MSFVPSIHWLLVFVPLAMADHWLHLTGSEVAVFVFSCLGIVPLAELMGKSTEAISERCGPSVGGFLNATFGNAAELIIAFIALKNGFIDVVKASLTGSIIGNLLLVVGVSMVAGGVKYPVQKFSRLHAGISSLSLITAAIALFIPSVYHYAADHSGRPLDQLVAERLSLGIAIIILCTYLCHLVFSLKTHKLEFPACEHEVGKGEGWGMNKAAGVLVGATVMIAILSEMMVGAIDAVKTGLGLSEVFIGVIVVAIVGNAAEHSTAILVAMKNRMDLALEIAVGSSLQVGMLLAPILVFASFALGKPMTLEFTIPEVVAVMATVWLTSHVISDGESTWLDGAQLLSLYLILAILFFFLPS